MKKKPLNMTYKEFVRKSRNNESSTFVNKDELPHIRKKKKNNVKFRKKKIKKKNRNKKVNKFKRNKFVFSIKDFFISFVIAIILGIGILFFFFGFTKVKGYSMAPTIGSGDVVVFQKNKVIKRFDLVVIDRGGSKQVRRVVGLPGEEVNYKTDDLYIDDKPIDEKFIIDEINETEKNGGQYTEDFSILSLIKSSNIPNNKYLVLGDNRPYATDSRSYGLIDNKSIVGVVVMRILPISKLEIF